MKPMNRLQSALFLAGGVLMVAGAGCFALLWQRPIACWVYLAGASLFSSMQVMQTYEGRSHTVKRLKQIMTFADLFFVLAGLLMVDTVHQVFLPLFDNYLTYYDLLFNKWVVLLLIAALLEIYTMHRISSELGKE
ncbi:MAG: hypothetical protein ACI4UC_08095 [Alloprevotella sp.]